jgi:hypothetical protein
MLPKKRWDPGIPVNDQVVRDSRARRGEELGPKNRGATEVAAGEHRSARQRDAERRAFRMEDEIESVDVAVTSMSSVHREIGF